MEHTYEDLKHKTLAELREIAKGLDHEAVKGYTQLNKEHLLPAVCTALGIDTHAHHHVVGLNKGEIKGRLKTLKAERSQALAAGDHARLKQIRRRYHRLERRIRRATV